MLEGMRILITGACGFIGTHAVARWAPSNEVLGLDNLARRGADANLAWLRSGVPLTFRRLDIRQAEALSDVVLDFQPDLVLHEAAQVAVTTSVVNPREDFEVNALGSLNVLEAVRQHCPRAVLVYASTNKVYGGMDGVGVGLCQGRYGYTDLPHGVAEQQPLDFHSPYGCSKGAADQYFLDYARIYGLRTLVFRQSCIYGTRQFGMEDQGWVAWFTIRAVQGRPVTIYGDGRQVRDVLWVGDLLDAYEAGIQRIETTAGRVYNMGGGPGNTLSLLELVGLLEARGGRALEHSFADWRPGDQRVFIADIRAAQRELDWAPRVSPAEGVSRLHAWVAANRELFGEPPSHRGPVEAGLKGGRAPACP